MKSEFEARPSMSAGENRIRAHFLTCYISLLVYRLLEKKLGNTYTCSQLLKTLMDERNETIYHKWYVPPTNGHSLLMTCMNWPDSGQTMNS